MHNFLWPFLAIDTINILFAIWIIYHTAANYEGDKYENNNKAYATEGILNKLYKFNQGFTR